MESATGDHNSNGDAEQAVQKVEDEVRTWLDATSDAIGDRIPPRHDLLPWMIEHAMSVYRRTHVGSDGRTVVERIRGRRGRDLIAEFAESMLYLPLRGNIADKRNSKMSLDPRFLNGIFPRPHRQQR